MNPKSLCAASDDAAVLTIFDSSVLALADGTRSIRDIADQMSDTSGAIVTQEAVFSACDTLSDLNLLEHRMAPPAGAQRVAKGGLTRRAAFASMARLGATAAAGAVFAGSAGATTLTAQQLLRQQEGFAKQGNESGLKTVSEQLAKIQPVQTEQEMKTAQETADKTSAERQGKLAQEAQAKSQSVEQQQKNATQTEQEQKVAGELNTKASQEASTKSQSEVQDKQAQAEQNTKANTQPTEQQQKQSAEAQAKTGNTQAEVQQKQTAEANSKQSAETAAKQSTEQTDKQNLQAEQSAKQAAEQQGKASLELEGKQTLEAAQKTAAEQQAKTMTGGGGTGEAASKEAAGKVPNMPNVPLPAPGILLATSLVGLAGWREVRTKRKQGDIDRDES